MTAVMTILPLTVVIAALFYAALPRSGGHAAEQTL